jgi:hypothetical protein
MTVRNSIFITLLLISNYPLAYEIRSHEAITEQAIKQVDLPNLVGVDKKEVFPNPAIMNCKGGSLRCNNLGKKTEGTYEELLLNGSSNEDLDVAEPISIDSCRPLNHFYDPVHDKGLFSVGSDGNPIFGVNSNPDWAMESPNLLFPIGIVGDVTEILKGVICKPYRDQTFSYPDAYSYLYSALTTTDATGKDRDINFGKMFQSLGQVLHLLQDMAAIEHVRDDPHIYTVKSQYSRYETYTELIADKARNSKAPSYDDNFGSIPNFLPFNSEFLLSTDVINFSKAKDYWVTQTGVNAANGKGLSEFTNTNFFSQDTNLEMLQEEIKTTFYALPKPSGGIEDKPIRALFASINKPLPEQLETVCPIDDSTKEDCIMGFVQTTVKDNVTGRQSNLVNTRASSFSLFDMDLQFRKIEVDAIHNCSTSPDSAVCTTKINRLFALNRFNFDEMHKFLIPRAVAYSAGLLKHFFRGKLEISRPDTGFYFDVDSIADITDANTGSITKSYQKISLKAQNTTEQAGSWAQDMSGGNIEVVVRYTLPNNTEEKVSNSSKQTATLLVGDIPTKLTFDLSNSPVPVDAENVNLYLVYRGTLGEETDVVVVGRQSVEPLTIETVAGTGVGGFSGDGGFAKNAQLYVPHSIALDNEGNLYISEYGNDRIRKVFTNGTIITIAGSGQRGYSTGGGSALQASLDGPTGIAIGPEGAVYFIDSYNNTLRKVLNSTITNVAGNFYSGGYVKTATGNPVGVRDGRLIFNGSTLYMTQSTMSTIYKIDGNLASIIAGNVAYNPWNPAPYPNNGASALQTTLGIPYGITWHNGALHFSDLLYKQVFKLDSCTNGTNCLYTVAGNGNSGFAEDNVAATQASLNYPSGVASSPSGNLYITAENEHRVRSVGADGKITTIAGNGIAGSSGDGGLPIKASLNTPSGLVVAPNGDLYITELNGHRVRRIKGLK